MVDACSTLPSFSSEEGLKVKCSKLCLKVKKDRCMGEHLFLVTGDHWERCTIG